MLRKLLPIVSMFPALALAAATAVVTPGDWSLYRGTSIVSRHTTEVACVDAAKALNVSRSYTCRTSSGVAVTVTVDPPPPPPPIDPPPVTGARYASPTGTGAACTDAAPCSLDTALGAVGTIVLKNGTYPAIGWTGSAETYRILSGSTVQAQNPGGAVINGLWIGRSARKDSNITVRDVRIEGSAQLYNTQRVTLKNVGVHGPLGIGTNDHAQGNSDNLIEDVWVWASGQRIIAINYRSDRNVWRRVIVRGDGCGTAGCAGSGNPNVGITIYDSSDVSFQNVLVLDRVLASGDSPYADFACAQHTTGANLWGRNEWLGVVSLNSPDQALYCEPDNVVPGVVSATLRDSVFWNGAGVNFSRQGKYVLADLTITNRAGDGVRIAPELSGTGTSVTNVTVGGTGRAGINSSVGASASNITGTWSVGPLYYPGSCTGCGTVAPVWKAPARYGVDGSRFGETGVNAQQGALLPYPNDSRIRAEMCANTSRGFCSKASVSEYLQAR